MARLTAFLFLMLTASVMDVRTREIPDAISLMLAAVGLLPPEPARMLGILAALPLFLAGLTVGGVGGGDIKVTAACGMVLGAGRASMGLAVGLLLMVAFHGIRTVAARDRKKGVGRSYPFVPFLAIGMSLALWAG